MLSPEVMLEIQVELQILWTRSLFVEPRTRRHSGKLLRDKAGATGGREILHLKGTRFSSQSRTWQFAIIYDCSSRASVLMLSSGYCGHQAHM